MALRFVEKYDDYFLAKLFKITVGKQFILKILVYQQSLISKFWTFQLFEFFIESPFLIHF